MDAAQLSTITDAEVLRGIVAEKLIELADRDAKIAQHEAQALAHHRAIVYKDSKIAALTAEVGAAAACAVRCTLGEDGSGAAQLV